jgi:hypothetical protein
MKSASRTIEPFTGIVPRLNGSAGEVSVTSMACWFGSRLVSVIAVTCTFSAAAIPVLMMGNADKSVVGFGKLTPGAPADRTTGDAAHSIVMVKKLPGLEASLTVSRF